MSPSVDRITARREWFSLKPILDTRLFVGRTAIAEEVKALVSGGPFPDFVFIHGGQKIGITSLLLHLHRTTLGLPSVLTCPIDLRRWRLMTAEQAVGHFASTLEPVVRGLMAEGSEQDDPYLFDDLVHELSRRPHVQLVLLIDGGDALVDADLRRVLKTVVGLLNDSVPNLGIVVGVGPGDHLDTAHFGHRIELMGDAIAEIPALWGRSRKRTIGMLHSDAGLRFLEAASGGAMDDDERAWAEDLSGGHPFLLNRIGLTHARGRPGQGRRERADLEADLARQIRPMARAIITRLRAGCHGNDLVALVNHLASHPGPAELRPGATDAEVVGILAGEGLVWVEDMSGRTLVHPVSEVNADAPVRYWMRSRLMREAIRLAWERSSVAMSSPRRERPPHLEAVVRTGEQEVVVGLTDIEGRILDRLLRSHGELLRPDELATAVWGNPPDDRAVERWHERLKQRLSMLRRKLGGEAIITVYGQGYRLATPERIILRS